MGHGLAWRTHSRPEPFSYQDILSWAQACGFVLMPWQMAALTLMDETYRDAIANPQEKLPEIPATAGNIRLLLQALGLKKK